MGQGGIFSFLFSKSGTVQTGGPPAGNGGWRRSVFGNFACRFCHKAVYASQKNNQIGRKRPAASKLRLLQLGSWPDINEPMPSKPKWTRRRTYHRIRNEIQVLEA